MIRIVIYISFCNFFPVLGKQTSIIFIHINFFVFGFGVDEKPTYVGIHNQMHILLGYHDHLVMQVVGEEYLAKNDSHWPSHQVYEPVLRIFYDKVFALPHRLGVDLQASHQEDAADDHPDHKDQDACRLLILVVSLFDILRHMPNNNADYVEYCDSNREKQLFHFILDMSKLPSPSYCNDQAEYYPFR